MSVQSSTLPGSEVRSIRVRLGLTQKQFAELVHLHSNTVAKLERGEIGMRPSTDALIRRLAFHARLSVRAGRERKMNSGKVKTVPTDLLLRGALYALAECGRKLDTARLLIEHHRYPDAAALTLLGREELGRHKILLDLWRESARGTPVVHGAVVKACEDHVEKQRRAQLSLTYRAEPNSQLAQLLDVRMKFTPASREWQDAEARLRALDDRKRKRQPEDRHKKRMNALYVDLVGSAWSRPVDLDPVDCVNEVADTLNDYAGARERVENPAIYEDESLAQGLDDLTDRPDLLPPCWLPIEALVDAERERKSA